MFKQIQESDPDLFLWLGDASYLDSVTSNYSLFKEDFIQKYIKMMFDYSKSNSYYQEFSKKKPVIGVWDDHDYGINDGNNSFFLKEEFKNLYFDFIDEPEDSPRRRVNSSMYASYSFGEGYKSAKIILLDCRYDKENQNVPERMKEVWESINMNDDDYDLFKKSLSARYDNERSDKRKVYTETELGELGRLKANLTEINNITAQTHMFPSFDEKYQPFYKSVFSEEQWEFLENDLKYSTETFIFLASGTQFLPLDKIVSESIYLKDRQRLFNLIEHYQKSGIILLSGDIHNANFLRTICIIPQIGYHIYEFTSSGLSHFCTSIPFLGNNTKICNLVFDKILPNSFSITPHHELLNYGLIEFNWGEDKESSSILMKVMNEENKVVDSIELNYGKDLTFNPNNKKDSQHEDINKEKSSVFNSEYEESRDYDSSCSYRNNRHFISSLLLIPIDWTKNNILKISRIKNLLCLACVILLYYFLRKYQEKKNNCKVKLSEYTEHSMKPEKEDVKIGHNAQEMKHRKYS